MSASSSALLGLLVAGMVALPMDNPSPAPTPADAGATVPGSTPSPDNSVSPGNTGSPSSTGSTAGATPAAAATPNQVTLTPQSVELHANVVDLTGTAQVSSTASRIDVRLNSNVLFAKDSATIQPKARKRLAEVGAQLKAAGQGKLDIVGYTDDLGSSEHGLTLSTQRATAVQKELAKYLAGIQTSVAGKGEADPVVPNTNEANRAQNRRVELHYTKG